MKRINVEANNHSYDIFIGSSLLDEIDKYLDKEKKYVVITDDYLPKKYLDKIKEKINILTYEIAFGEKSKTINTVLDIISFLENNNVDKGYEIIALGGGVINDIAGFVASIYKRGLKYTNIPTTLLAQVDASIGGKTGVNFDEKKNLIGSIYPPRQVLIDTKTLETLDQRNFNNGMAEIIKVAMIYDKDLFYKLLKDEDVKKNIEEYIFEAVLIKRYFIEKDEFDLKERRALNFGHTIGHALEMADLSLLHGEAVAYGMKLMSFYNKDLIKLLDKFDLNKELNISFDKLVPMIKQDKKEMSNKFNLIIVKDIGKYEIIEYNLDEIKKFWR